MSGYLWEHRALIGYVTLLALVGALFQIRQANTNADIRETNRQACLALVVNVEAQRLALLALIRASIATEGPAIARELPYLRLALTQLDEPRCAR